MLRHATFVLTCLLAMAVHAGSTPATNNASLRDLLKDLQSDHRSAHPKLLGYETLIDAARNGCPSPEQLARVVSATLPDSKAEEPIELFFLPALVRLTHQFRGCFSPGDLSTIERNLTANRQKLFGHGTVNHAAMRATSWYLLAEQFPAAIWTDWDGRKWTSAEVRQRLKANLQSRWKGVYQQGHCEWLSPTYAVVNLFPILNLIDFSKDPEIRAGAEAEANLEMAIVLANSFHGTILPPLTRKNYDQRNASNQQLKYTPSVTQSALKLYTGEPALLSNSDWWGRVEPPYVIMLALSNWRPIFPVELFSTVKKETGLYIRTATPSFSEWGKKTDVEIIGESFITENYSLSAGNARFQPDLYYQHIQVNGVSLKTNGEFNQIECYHPYFSNPGDRASWGTDRWSPFLQSSLTSPTSMAIVGVIPDRDPWPGNPTSPNAKLRSGKNHETMQAVFCRIPKSLTTSQPDKQHLHVTNGPTSVEIESQTGPFEEITDTVTHWHYQIRSPSIRIAFGVHDANAVGQPERVRPVIPTFSPPKMYPNGYVSYDKLNQDAIAQPPISSSSISLSNGELKISVPGGAVTYTCHPGGCKKVVNNGSTP